jgi:hypothetical protein
MKNIIYSLILVFLAVSCDIIEAPYEEDGGNQVVKPPRNVLIEDFTGFRCGNCPPAGVEAQAIIEANPGRVFGMAIHVGVLATPTQSHPYEFRTDVGNSIDEFYGISLIGTPMGLINRTEYDDKIILTYPNWANAVEEQLSLTADMSIELEAEYNSATSTITVNPKLIYFEDVSPDHYFNIYITENNIIEYQKWYNNDPDDIYDFEHNHVLRDGFYGAWGEQVSSLFSGGDTLTAELTYSIPQGKDWNPENLNLIGVVMDTKNDNEILQVQEIHLK